MLVMRGGAIEPYQQLAVHSGAFGLFANATSNWKFAIA